MQTFLRRKILYSVGIILLYLLGRSIPIPWVLSGETYGSIPAGPQDLSAFLTDSMLGRSSSSASILSLGFGPWMSAMILVTVIRSLQSREKRQQAAYAQRLQRWTMVLTLLIATVQAWLRASELPLTDAAASIASSASAALTASGPSSAAGSVYAASLSGVFPAAGQGFWQGPLFAERLLTTLVLIAGSFLCVFLADQNQQKGLGGSGLLIMVNILDSLGQTLAPYAASLLNGTVLREGRALWYALAILYCLILLFLMVLFHSAEFRVPVNRVMIHNVYADKDYVAIRLNPAGTMPVMFALTFFMLPVYALRFLALLLPSHAAALQNCAAWFSLPTPHGIVLYLVIMAVLTVVFARVNVDTQEIADSFMKSGDCLPGIRPGKETAQYLDRLVRFGTTVSVLLMAAGISIPLLAGTWLGFSQQIMLLPTTLMVLIGTVLQILEEYATLKTFEYYRPFL